MANKLTDVIIREIEVFHSPKRLNLIIIINKAFIGHRFGNSKFRNDSTSFIHEIYGGVDGLRIETKQNNKITK